MKSEEKSEQQLIKRQGRGATKISRDQSTAFPDIQEALVKAGLNFCKSYIYRVLAGTCFNHSILQIANPIVEKTRIARLKLEAQRNKHLAENGDV
jgi:hypothetical protein